MDNLISMEQAAVTGTVSPPLPQQDFRSAPLAQVRMRNNYRQTFDPVKLEELAASVRSRGILQPVLVREVKPDAFEIVAGGRRFRAAQMAELTEMPARVVSLTEEEVLEFQLIELSEVQPVV